MDAHPSFLKAGSQPLFRFRRIRNGSRTALGRRVLSNPDVIAGSVEVLLVQGIARFLVFCAFSDKGLISAYWKFYGSLEFKA